MSKKECGFCDGTGIRTIANGPDDFDAVFCSCDIGISAQEKAESSFTESRMFDDKI